jgi:magnesium transporter
VTSVSLDAVEVRASLYLSQVLGRPVLDAAGARIARVHDLVARFGSEPHPPISGVVARRSGREFYVDVTHVVALSHRPVRPATFTVNLRPFERRDGEVLLKQDILDKQLIDVHGRRVVRANDLELAEVDGRYRLVGVDVGVEGLVTGAIKARRVVYWEDVESFAIDVPMVRLRVPHDRLARLHPVEIAHIVETLSPQRGREVLESLAEGVAADAVQELHPDAPADLMQGLDRERAADILDEMEPDDAADLLGDLPAERANDLLGLMEPDERDDVAELLAYDEDTAAGLMTTEYVALPAGLTAAEGLARLRALEEPPDPLYHVYFVADEANDRLVGVVPLRDLVLTTDHTPLHALAWHDFQAVRADETSRTVAERMAEYDLAAVPVVDDRGALLGIVTIDDAVDVLVPRLWQRRRSRLFR